MTDAERIATLEAQVAQLTCLLQGKNTLRIDCLTSFRDRELRRILPFTKSVSAGSDMRLAVNHVLKTIANRDRLSEIPGEMDELARKAIVKVMDVVVEACKEAEGRDPFHFYGRVRQGGIPYNDVENGTFSPDTITRLYEAGLDPNNTDIAKFQSCIGPHRIDSITTGLNLVGWKYGKDLKPTIMGKVVEAQ